MIITLIIISYALLLLFIASGMRAIPQTIINTKAQTQFSVIIPFKDEVDNLDLLLQSLEKINYPSNLYEIILIDDHSEDASLQIIKQYKKLNLVVLKNDDFGKKSALEKAIVQAKNEWIITTDADCELPANWLLAYNEIIVSTKAKMVLAPVVFFNENSFIGQLQQIEFLSLQALTMASYHWSKPFLSNGANLAFLKSAFLQVNGYKGNKHIASGDDVFLLEKFNTEFPNDIQYLKTKEALVKTQTQKDWKNLIQQKIRWGSKTKKFKSVLPKLIGVLVLLANFLVLICFVLGKSETYYLWLIAVKFIFDFIYIKYINQFFNTKITIKYFISTFIAYPLYYIVLSFLSFKNNYYWKGRNI